VRHGWRPFKRGQTRLGSVPVLAPTMGGPRTTLCGTPLHPLCPRIGACRRTWRSIGPSRERGRGAWHRQPQHAAEDGRGTGASESRAVPGPPGHGEKPRVHGEPALANSGRRLGDEKDDLGTEPKEAVASRDSRDSQPRGTSPRSFLARAKRGQDPHGKNRTNDRPGLLGEATRIMWKLRQRVRPKCGGRARHTPT
jgi:hypothetical protein